MEYFSSIGTAFLFGFLGLFPVVNPIGSALIFDSMITGAPDSERKLLAKKIALYSLIIMLSTMWFGSYILHFFGISIPALRIAGGLVVAAMGWTMLKAPSQRHDEKQAEGNEVREKHEKTGSSFMSMAFYPLTMPILTGPGTIAVAIALSASRPGGKEAFVYLAGYTLSAVSIAAMVWVLYRESGRIVGKLGPTTHIVVNRLIAFLLLCIGVEIMLLGVSSALQSSIGIGVGLIPHVKHALLTSF